MHDNHWKLREQRVRVLNRARELARSGQHSDHQSILAELELAEGFADTLDWLELICPQLDRLCALALSAAALNDVPGRTTSPTSTWTPGHALRQLP